MEEWREKTAAACCRVELAPLFPNGETGFALSQGAGLMTAPNPQYLMKTLGALFLLLACTAGLLANDSGPRLCTAYQQAHAAKDVNAFLELIEFARTTPELTRTQIAEAFSRSLSRRISTIEIQELTGTERTSFESGGVAYVTTLPVVRRLKISYTEEGQGPARVTTTTYLLGEKSGEYRIVSTMPKK